MNNSSDTREKIIIRTSIIGILTNSLLAVFKAAVGFFTNSIAITLDAVNNFSDVLSSVITIVGTKLAGKQPDKEHPMGHGRIEYLTATVISIIILYVGVAAFIESVKKLIEPQTPQYTAVSMMIIAVAVAAKLVLGIYVGRIGKSVNSGSLSASGKDALFDSIISAATLAAAAVYLLLHISLEAWLGAAIALFIIKSGFDMLGGTISEILGERADSGLSRSVKDAITSVEGVRGAYDLILNNYGPDKYVASVHIEVPSDMNARELDAVTRQIEKTVHDSTGVIMGGVSIYAVDTEDTETVRMQLEIMKKVIEHPHVLQMHAFYADMDNKKIKFDAVADFDVEDRAAMAEELKMKIQRMYPDFKVDVVLDFDLSD